MEKTDNLKILDCTVRDGGYVNNWKFEKKFVRESYRVLSRAGVDYVELGFRGTDQYFDRSKYGLWRFSEDALLNEVTGGVDGARVSIMADFGKIEEKDFDSSANSPIDLVRVAVHKNKIRDAVKLLEKIKNKGYEVSLNAMGISGYSSTEVRDIVDLLKHSSIDYIYIADSYGSIFPDQIRSIAEPFLELSDIEVGFHPHNNLQMAFANTLEAIRCGVSMIDSSMYGMGRGAGNLPTEIILAYLQKEKSDKYNVIPVLNCVDTFLIQLYKDKSWGYSLPTMLSGIFSNHPNYVKDLFDRKRYTIEDIWRVLEIVKKKEPVGYNKEILEEVILNSPVSKIEPHEVDMSGAATSPDDLKSDTVTYRDRYKGKTFLILANGPSLKKYHHSIQSFIEKYQPVVMGANYLGGLFKPDYHAFTLPKRFLRFYDTVHPESKILLGEYIPPSLTEAYLDRPFEQVIYDDIVNKPFDIDDSGKISTNCRTVSILLAGVAIVMGAERIFIAGMDGYISTDKNGHFLFYRDQDEYEDNELVMERHRWCAWHLEQINNYLLKKDKEGIHIITPTSYYNFYTGIENFIK